MTTAEGRTSSLNVNGGPPFFEISSVSLVRGDVDEWHGLRGEKWGVATRVESYAISAKTGVVRQSLLWFDSYVLLINLPFLKQCN